MISNSSHDDMGLIAEQHQVGPINDKPKVVLGKRFSCDMKLRCQQASNAAATDFT